jgi:hypothetical protein
MEIAMPRSAKGAPLNTGRTPGQTLWTKTTSEEMKPVKRICGKAYLIIEPRRLKKSRSRLGRRRTIKMRTSRSFE